MSEPHSAQKLPAAKPKRILSENQLEKLKIAREKALQVKKMMKENSDDKKVKHYEEKIRKIKGKTTEEEPVREKLEEVKLQQEEPLDEPGTESEPEMIETKSKTTKKKSKPIVICEESSSDEDENKVIYIKKGRRKERAAQQPPAELPLPPPPPVQRQVIMNPNPFHRFHMNPHYM